ncbi:hypothetical protein SAMN05216390_1493 [Lachnospiraceae bacterium KH1T2]|nr:hypothetical protein SAMN05216390_1493 [Lachnospiraceae bacterium KH1T2]
MARNLSSVGDGLFSDLAHHNEAANSLIKENLQDDLSDKPRSASSAMRASDAKGAVNSDNVFENLISDRPRAVGDNTRGKKGEKLPRITMCFNPEVYEYVNIESRRRGMSKTTFINHVLAKYSMTEEGHIKF